MRINPYSSKLNIYRQSVNQGSAKSYASFQRPYACGSVAYKGLAIDVTPAKKIISKINVEPKDEIYKINLFDKLNGEFVETLFNCTPAKYIQNGKDLSILDKEGKFLGGVSINLSQEPDTNCYWKDYIRLHNLQSKSKNRYKGIGSTLIQAAVEQSMNTSSKGRIYVFACNTFDLKNDPFIFYNKMGLSVKNLMMEPVDLSPYLDDLTGSEQIQLKKELGSRNPEDLDPDEFLLSIYKAVAAAGKKKLDEVRIKLAEFMWLHDNKVKEIWAPKIKANPIFNEENRLV